MSLLQEPDAPAPEVIPLEPGDHLDRATFHARYAAMPEDVQAELIGGVVYMASPVRRRHGGPSAEVIGWLVFYKAATPGVEVLDHASVLLADDSEPQPDACMLILPEHGGQTSVDEQDYVVGCPELVVEVAASSAAIDLHEKKQDYEKGGAREYIVVLVHERRVVWFVHREGQLVELAPGADGLLRSDAFPGLWLDPEALLRRDTAAVLAALQRGLQSPEHQAFVARLRSARSQ